MAAQILNLPAAVVAGGFEAIDELDDGRSPVAMMLYEPEAQEARGVRRAASPPLPGQGPTEEEPARKKPRRMTPVPVGPAPSAAEVDAYMGEDVKVKAFLDKQLADAWSNPKLFKLDPAQVEQEITDMKTYLQTTEETAVDPKAMTVAEAQSAEAVWSGYTRLLHQKAATQQRLLIAQKRVIQRGAKEQKQEELRERKRVKVAAARKAELAKLAGDDLYEDPEDDDDDAAMLRMLAAAKAARLRKEERGLQITSSAYQLTIDYVIARERVRVEKDQKALTSARSALNHLDEYVALLNGANPRGEGPADDLEWALQQRSAAYEAAWHATFGRVQPADILNSVARTTLEKRVETLTHNLNLRSLKIATYLNPSPELRPSEDDEQAQLMFHARSSKGTWYDMNIMLTMVEDAMADILEKIETHETLLETVRRDFPVAIRALKFTDKRPARPSTQPAGFIKPAGITRAPFVFLRHPDDDAAPTAESRRVWRRLLEGSNLNASAGLAWEQAEFLFDDFWTSVAQYLTGIISMPVELAGAPGMPKVTRYVPGVLSDEDREPGRISVLEQKLLRGIAQLFVKRALTAAESAIVLAAGWGAVIDLFTHEASSASATNMPSGSEDAQGGTIAFTQNKNLAAFAERGAAAWNVRMKRGNRDDRTALTPQDFAAKYGDIPAWLVRAAEEKGLSKEMKGEAVFGDLVAVIGTVCPGMRLAVAHVHYAVAVENATAAGLGLEPITGDAAARAINEAASAFTAKALLNEDVGNNPPAWFDGMTINTVAPVLTDEVVSTMQTAAGLLSRRMSTLNDLTPTHNAGKAMNRTHALRLLAKFFVDAGHTMATVGVRDPNDVVGIWFPKGPMAKALQYFQRVATQKNVAKVADLF
jgi:hypothetical protein